MSSQSPVSRARLLTIPYPVGYVKQFDVKDEAEYDRNLALVEEAVAMAGLKDELRKGDCIYVGPLETRYRNDELYFWNGVSVEETFNGIDDYGSVPLSLVVTDTEFDPCYWSEVVEHNSIFNLDSKLAQTLNFKLVLKSTEDNENYMDLYESPLVIGGRMYRVFTHSKEPLADPPEGYFECYGGGSGDGSDLVEDAADYDLDSRCLFYYSH